MKITRILFLTALVAIAKEKTVAEYLLVEVDGADKKGRIHFYCYLILFLLRQVRKILIKLHFIKS